MHRAAKVLIQPIYCDIYDDIEPYRTYVSHEPATYVYLYFTHVIHVLPLHLITCVKYMYCRCECHIIH